MSALEPGLYRATVRGVPDTVLIVDKNGMGHHALLDARPNDIGVTHTSVGDLITDARSLIIVDFNWFTERIPEALKAVRESSLSATISGEVICDILHQIEAQTKPPRMAEPGMWGVVKAEYDGKRRDFVRNVTGWNAPAYTGVKWQQLIDPVLVRDGI